MGKNKTSFSYRLNKVVKSNSDFTTDGQKLYCVVCDKPINVTEKHLKNRVDDHFQSDIHNKKNQRELKLVIISLSLYLPMH